MTGLVLLSARIEPTISSPDLAHQELLAADRMQETVTGIAARWGFMHTGRFAVLHRQTYGQSPHTTLRN